MNERLWQAYFCALFMHTHARLLQELRASAKSNVVLACIARGHCLFTSSPLVSEREAKPSFRHPIPLHWMPR